MYDLLVSLVKSVVDKADVELKHVLSLFSPGSLVVAVRFGDELTLSVIYTMCCPPFYKLGSMFPSECSTSHAIIRSICEFMNEYVAVAMAIQSWLQSSAAGSCKCL